MTNSWMDLLVALIIGIGFGSIVSAFIKKRFEEKRLIFEAKLLKYGDLLDAYHNVVSSNSSEQMRQKYVSAQKQVALVGTSEVVQLSEEFYKKSATKTNFIRDSLVKAMRKDLLKYYYHNMK